ncbi:MFS transporter, SP family, galactose:H+ symporter [Dyella jiangningensis]|uniref:sugar porter family MFS transporter n=2 Tax=Gammaproteobacteria TaxID=1236 RepID=UPI000884B628|nr:sugar porter family MFS transporter [Dyella sp. AtDHG13]PXV61279.1 SP family galactose:H+ symporter-like MFS transporter [Dyella sp. AtDHG13]SDJ96199.1 MFS transporter, SP family, galactose:H+ symporter [Dyella jiangningensis]
MNAQVIAPSSVQSKATVVFVCVLAALAGLMFGLDVGVISGATQFIQAEYKVGDHVIEWIVSSMMFGAAIGAVGAGWLSAHLGRKRSLVLGAVLFVIGSLLSGLAWSPETLIAARVVLGVAIGLASFTAPLYLAEVAPEYIRGAMISTYQLMITIGIFVAFLSDTAFSYSGAWRWMLGVIAIPGVLFLVGVLFLPDSPRWLLMRGRRQEALDVLQRLRGDSDVVARETADIEEQLKTPQRGWHLFQENRNFRRSVWLGVLLQVMQQFTGMNVVMYYAPRIFQEMGYDTAAQMWFTALVGLTNVLATFIAIALIDRWGRKPILYTGFTVMTVGLGVVGAMMHNGIHDHGAQIFTVAMLLIFIVGFAMSAGPLIWALCSEIQPLKGRDFGIACSTFTNWACNWVVGITFLTLLNGIGNANTFWLYAALNAVFIVLTYWLVPETKGVTLEQIERNLMSGKRLRDIGR